MMRLRISVLSAICDAYASNMDKVVVAKDLLPDSLKMTLAVNFTISFAARSHSELQDVDSSAKILKTLIPKSEHNSETRFSR